MFVNQTYAACSTGLNYCGVWTFNPATWLYECYGQAGTGVPCVAVGNTCEWATDLGCGSVYGGCNTGSCSGTPDSSSSSSSSSSVTPPPGASPTSGPSPTPAPTTPPACPAGEFECYNGGTCCRSSSQYTPDTCSCAAAACAGSCLKSNPFDPDDIWHGGPYGTSQCDSVYLPGHYQWWPGGTSGAAM